jgi:hypothetical protein
MTSAMISPMRFILRPSRARRSSRQARKWKGRLGQSGYIS